MSVFRQLLMQKASRPKAWRNFAENPATWDDLNTAWSAMANQDFEFEMEYIDFGLNNNSAVINSYIQHYSYANSNATYSGYVQYQPITSSVTGTNVSGNFVFIGSFAVGYAKSAYPKNDRHKLNVKLSIADNTITTTIDGVSAVCTPVLLDLWSYRDGLSNFNGHIFSMTLKDGNGNIVWSAPMSELKA